jgi:hypothetical protein
LEIARPIAEEAKMHFSLVVGDTGLRSGPSSPGATALAARQCNSGTVLEIKDPDGSSATAAAPSRFRFPHPPTDNGDRKREAHRNPRSKHQTACAYSVGRADEPLFRPA